eukprot:11158613-Lingulodinium_polyedra.AAC.1
MWPRRVWPKHMWLLLPLVAQHHFWLHRFKLSKAAGLLGQNGLARVAHCVGISKVCGSKGLRAQGLKGLSLQR